MTAIEYRDRQPSIYYLFLEFVPTSPTLPTTHITTHDTTRTTADTTQTTTTHTDPPGYSIKLNAVYLNLRILSYSLSCRTCC